jgi:hypothetical protein
VRGLQIILEQETRSKELKERFKVLKNVVWRTWKNFKTLKYGLEDSGKIW